MTLVSSIITSGFRESNFTGQGTTLTDIEQSEGLALLQSLVDSFIPLVINTKYRQWWIPFPNVTSPETRRWPAEPGQPQERPERDVFYPPSNSRVLLRNDSAETVYFQYEPEDGSVMQIVDAGFTADVTLSANGHYFGDVGTETTVALTPAQPGGNRNPVRTYVFRGDIASWVEISALIYAGEMPFPAMFDDYWITSLAMRLAPRYGNEPAAITLNRYKDMMVMIRGWYRQTSETLTGEPGIRSEQSYYGGRFLNDPDMGRI